MSKIDELIEKICPNGVKFEELKEICMVSIGEFVHKNKQREDAKYPVFNGGISNTGFYDEYNNEGNKILISARGANAGFINKIESRYWAGNSCYSIEVKDKSSINWLYVYYYLKNDEKSLLGQQQTGSIPAISKKQIESFKIPVPPLEVQCEIVHILDDFTLLSAELSAELKARQSQYNFYKDKIFNISEKTNYVEIKDILQEKGYIRGPFGSALRKSDMVKNGVPIYEQQHAIYNHRNFRYFISNEKANNLSRFMVKEGDIILSCSGTVGRTSIIKSADEKGVINQALLILRIDSNKINVRFLEHFLNSSYGKKKILSNTNGSAQVNICKREEFEKIKIPLPKIDEQNKIVNILDRFEKLCNDISEGLPAEIEARQKQYEYYRDKLLTFKELKVNE